MPRTPKANITPAVLAWARERMGLNRAVAAGRIGVTAERLAAWEMGDRSPTIAQLRKAAHVYRRPLALFFMPKPPASIETRLRDFRRLPDADDLRSAELAAEILRAVSQREVMLDLAEEMGDEPATFRGVPISSEDAHEAGRRVRALLGVSLDEQISWRNQYDALSGWTSAVEALGVLVVQTSRIPLPEIRGFSISEAVLPIIALNGSDAVRGKVFTLLHEVTHLLLNSGGLCDLHERGTTAFDAVEVYCNRVAASVLLPAESFQTEELVRAGLRDEEWNDRLLDVLARRYGVSMEVVLRRLLTLGLVSQSYYTERRQEFLERYEQSRAAASGAPPYHIVRMRDLGRPYVSTVLEAYHSDAITATDVSEFLGVRLKHLPKIEEALYRTAQR